MKKSYVSHLLTFLVFTILLVGCTQTAEQTAPKIEDKKQPTAIVEQVTESTETTEQSRPTPPTPPAPAPAPEGKVASNVKEFKVIAKQFSFEPAVIEVNKGDKVRLKLSTIDVPHGIGIPEFGINEVIPEGEEVTAEFTADKQGSFLFLCTVFCGSGHRNMKGTLIVK